MPSLKALLGAGLAATVALASPIQSLDFSDLAPRADPSLTGYLGAFFLGADPYVYLYLSNGNNAVSFRALNSGSPVIKPTKGTGGVRDPAIVEGGGAEKGKKWYIVGTDLDIGKTTWDAAQRQGSKGIFVWESTDLVNWSGERLVVVENSSAGMVWAPEAIWDPSKGQYLVHWASKFYPSSDPNHTGAPGPIVIRYAYTSDFKTFSAPATYIDKSPTNIIDLNILPTGTDGKSFVRFLKDESLKTVFVEVSTTGLFGTWTRPGGASAIIQSGVEGPASYWDNQVAGKAHVLLDFYGEDGYRPYETGNVATNPSIPAVNTLIHAPRQDFGDFGVVASTTNPFVWKFPNTKVWIGSETLFPIPEEVQTLWARIKGGLLVTLEAVEGEMMREQSQEASLRKRHVQRRRFMTELRMSGCCQKHETGKDRKVTLYPCVWILCGSKWCRDKIRKVTERLELPQNLSSQRIEVLEGGPTFNASEVNIPRSQLDNDRALVPGVAHSGGTILHHIEVAPKQECRSICGMLCCTTFVKDGNVIDQHVSRIGGVLTESFFGLDYKIWPLALTTAHGIFDLLLSEASDDSELTSGSGKSKYLQPSASGSYSSDSESVYDTDEESSRSEAEIEILGNRNASSVTKWTPLEDVVGINFMGERLSSEQVFDRGTPADYTILRSDTLNSCRNLISSDPSVEVTTFVLNSNLTPGPVSLIIGIDEVSEASLLPDIVKMPWRQEALLVRKLYTSAPLGL
ncbi:hypothetical protein CGLO_13084 [Colletotrichum gloeosporioides Cg-14]|uniref:Arabinosidase n=1 Tax=Colletotrichum gloeosporioides (strain Cg-14) TaxID=1237896 RepID=T0LHU1_COLGC|nr:hypothetical protein CGLO_13084 [Colletotrichum gloeosporioides Cg-14]